MRVHVVSDAHGNAEALARAGEGADALLVLGDLVDFLDYRRPTGGVFGDVVGPEAGREVARLRAEGPPGAMRAYVGELFDAIENPHERVRDAVRAQYRRMFGALDAVDVPVYVIPGNVDSPSLWPEFATDRLHRVDGEVVEIGGRAVGFVGGVPLPPGMTPRPGVFESYMRPAEEYDAAIEALGPVDVVATHAPPAVAELAYDVVARNRELASEALLAAIRRHRPRAALFGHVHAPLARRVRVGMTECVNVGHFARLGSPCVMRW